MCTACEEGDGYAEGFASGEEGEGDVGWGGLRARGGMAVRCALMRRIDCIYEGGVRRLLGESLMMTCLKACHLTCGILFIIDYWACMRPLIRTKQQRILFSTLHVSADERGSTHFYRPLTKQGYKTRHHFMPYAFEDGSVFIVHQGYTSEAERNESEGAFNDPPVSRDTPSS